jgi:hypothetical protein
VTTTDRAVTEFAAALREADATLATIRERVAAARVPDDAFGKLFEAHAVRDTYHERLPTMTRNVEEARAVLAHFIKGLTGGHRLVARTHIPEQR